MVKAFLFDYGGVIAAGGGPHDLPARLGNVLGLPAQTAFELMDLSWHDYMGGLINQAEFWRRIEARAGRSIAVEQRNIWNTWETMRPYPQMVELLQRLKAKGFTVALLSNVIPVTAQELEAHGVYNLFDFTVLSYEVKLSKPDPLIYSMALAKMPEVQPSEVIYTDDQERCLVPAAELGMHTLQAVSLEQTIGDLEKFIT